MKVLVVIDIQDKYLSFYDHELINRINSRIEKASMDEVPVLYVRNIGIFGNTEGYDLANNLLIVSDHIYEKRTPSAFTNPLFVKTLSSLEPTTIEIIGIDGNCCVKKTCVDAVNSGYKVSLDLNCTAAKNRKIFDRTLKELSGLGVMMQ